VLATAVLAAACPWVPATAPIPQVVVFPLLLAMGVYLDLLMYDRAKVELCP
jgi:hypothetical protein